MTHASTTEQLPTAADLASRPDAAPSNYTGRDMALVLAAAFLGWMFDGLEMGIFPQIARPALTQLLAHDAVQRGLNAVQLENLNKWWYQIITAMFLFGAALGGLVFGWLGDKIGRVRAMSASILVYSVFTGLLYLAQSPEHIAALRFIAATGASPLRRCSRSSSPQSRCWGPGVPYRRSRRGSAEW